MEVVVQAKLLKVVLILGGFDLRMSFIESHLMKGSEVSEALGTVYGLIAVEHNMLFGKADEKALGGHFRISSALNSKLLSAFSPAYVEKK